MSRVRGPGLRRLALLLLSAMAVGACRPDDQRTDTIDPAAARAELSAATLAQIDSGNAAYRRGDYEGAVAAFGEVTVSAPDDPTGWFGLYMAHQSLGQAAAADSALDKARSLAPGASLIHPSADGGGGQP